MRILMCLLSSMMLIILILLIYIPFKEEMSKKQKKTAITWYIIIVSIYFVIYYVVDSCKGPGVQYLKVNMFIFGFVLGIVNMILFRNRWREMIFTIGLADIIFLMIMTIGAFCHQYKKVEDYHDFMIWYNLMSLLIGIITFIPARNLLIHTVTPFLNYKGKLNWGDICFMPLAMFIANFFVTPIGSFITSPGELTGRLMLGMVTLFLCKNVAYTYKQMQEKRLLYQQIDAQKKYYDSLLNNVQEARKNRHDLKHHLIAMNTLLEHNEIDEIKKYIAVLQDRANEEPQIYYTGNPALDGVIYHYMCLAKREEIEFLFLGSVPQLNDREIDLCVLLGNGLDNALTACKTTEEKRRIDISIEYDEYVMTITISNTFDGLFKKKEDVFLSRKRNYQSGYGIESMKDICNKYGGTYRFTVKDKIFEAVFLINL